MSDLPPIGSPPAGDPCSPCATPSDCPDIVEQYLRQVCALQSNYLDLLTRYQKLLSAVQSGSLSIKDIGEEIQQLQQQINDLSGANCANLGAATVADGLIVCLGGVQKVISAPELSGRALVSFKNGSGNWQFQLTTVPSYLDLGAVGQNIITVSGYTGSSQNISVTLPQFPTFNNFCIAFLNTNLTNTNGGASSSDLSLNGAGSVAHCGPQSQELWAFRPVSVQAAAQTFVLTATGDPRSTSCITSVLGYLYS